MASSYMYIFFSMSSLFFKYRLIRTLTKLILFPREIYIYRIIQLSPSGKLILMFPLFFHTGDPSLITHYPMAIQSVVLILKGLGSVKSVPLLRYIMPQYMNGMGKYTLNSYIYVSATCVHMHVENRIELVGKLHNVMSKVLIFCLWFSSRSDQDSGSHVLRDAVRATGADCGDCQSADRSLCGRSVGGERICAYVFILL